MKQLAFDLVAPEPPTLGNFVPGGNVELLQRLRDLGAVHGERSIYLWGAPVSGRTHLLRGTIAALERDGQRARYLAGTADLAAGALDELDAVAIDDVHRLDDQGQRTLFGLCNRQRDAGRILVAAGDAPPAGLRLRADLVTRLAWGLAYEVRALTDAEKMQALVHNAAARGFTLPPEVADYLLNHVQRDMRTLNATLEALDRYSLEVRRSITLPLVRDVLGSRSRAGEHEAGAPGRRT